MYQYMQSVCVISCDFVTACKIVYDDVRNLQAQVELGRVTTNGRAWTLGLCKAASVIKEAWLISALLLLNSHRDILIHLKS